MLTEKRYYQKLKELPDTDWNAEFLIQHNGNLYDFDLFEDKGQKYIELNLRCYNCRENNKSIIWKFSEFIEYLRNREIIIEKLQTILVSYFD